MSKHRPPASPTSPQIGVVNADSSVDAIRAERMRVAQELQRRKEYEYLRMLRARLDETPPIPEPHAPPANEG
ncbi:hypothetical protein [Caulobacter segnis]|uniref:Uncharacterized protein n=1 Tax=Caulobacter segnis TaxID=88688 RepID=A0A2W5XCU9_9CAUL|nr:hypothetical protein [Caulobacter segnis]PZR35271.1 MAG: hypothetical protein DI526_07610 [Caulobacter segnis]